MNNSTELSSDKILRSPENSLPGIDKPLLQKWGKIVTQRMFASSSHIRLDVKRNLLAIEGHLKGCRQHECYHVYVAQENTGTVISCLPYILGLASAVGRIPHSQMDLRDPILVITTCSCTKHTLQNILQSRTTDGNPPYLQQQGLLMASEICSGAYYQTVQVTSVNDAQLLLEPAESYDLILCSSESYQLIPDMDIAIVLVDENCPHSGKFSDKGIRNKFNTSTHILIFRHFQPSTKSPRGKNEYPLPLLSYFSSMITMQRISQFVSQAQLNALHQVKKRLLDMRCNHIPIVIDMATEAGMPDMICSLPYILGDVAYHNPQCMNLSKPILIIATDLEAWTTLRKVLSSHSEPYLVSSGIMKKDEYAQGAHYGWHRIKDEFEVCTYCRHIYKHELVLLTTDGSYLDGNKYVHVTTDCYKDLPRNQFSAIIIFENERCSIDRELDIMCRFAGVPMILFRVDWCESTEKNKVKVKSKISTVQHFNADTILPKLLEHNHDDITEKYILGRSSVLTDHQKAGLVSMVDWLVSNESHKEAAYVNSAVGYEKSGILIWCLPHILDWAHTNHLIPSGSLNLHKPLLVLYNDVGSYKILHGLFHSHPPFHQTVMFGPNASKNNFYVVEDPTTARQVATIAADHKIIFSDYKFLQWLPSDSFSAVIGYSSSHEHFMQENKKATTMKKFLGVAKLIFFEAHKQASMGSPVPFLLLSETENSHILHTVRQQSNKAKPISSNRGNLEQRESTLQVKHTEPNNRLSQKKPQQKLLLSPKTVASKSEGTIAEKTSNEDTHKNKNLNTQPPKEVEQVLQVVKLKEHTNIVQAEKSPELVNPHKTSKSSKDIKFKELNYQDRADFSKTSPLHQTRNKSSDKRSVHFKL